MRKALPVFFPGGALAPVPPLLHFHFHQADLHRGILGQLGKALQVFFNTRIEPSLEPTLKVGTDQIDQHGLAVGALGRQKIHQIRDCAAQPGLFEGFDDSFAPVPRGQ